MPRYTPPTPTPAAATARLLCVTSETASPANRRPPMPLHQGVHHPATVRIPLAKPVRQQGMSPQPPQLRSQSLRQPRPAGEELPAEEGIAAAASGFAPTLPSGGSPPLRHPLSVSSVLRPGRSGPAGLAAPARPGLVWLCRPVLGWFGCASPSWAGLVASALAGPVWAGRGSPLAGAKTSPERESESSRPQGQAEPSARA